MPFGGTHRDARQSLAEQVPGRLKKNQRLLNQLRDGHEVVQVPDGDLAWRLAGTVPLDGQKLTALYHWIAKGLAQFHFGVTLAPDKCVVLAGFLAGLAAEWMESLLLAKNCKQRAVCDLGDGAFT